MKSKEIIEVGFMPKTMDSGPHLADGKKAPEQYSVFNRWVISMYMCRYQRKRLLVHYHKGRKT